MLTEVGLMESVDIQSFAEGYLSALPPEERNQPERINRIVSLIRTQFKKVSPDTIRMLVWNAFERLHRVIRVYPMNNFSILLWLYPYQWYTLDCRELLCNPWYRCLEDPDVFRTVHLDQTGVVCWNNLCTDIEPQWLYSHIKPAGKDKKAISYRYELNLMHTKICKFLRQHHDTDRAEELTKIRRKLSLAYNEAFFHCDKEHFVRWKRLLKNSKQVLSMAGTNRMKLSYKGYTATMYCYQDDVESGTLYHGKVDVDNAMITFGGKTMEEAEQDFHDGIDDILDLLDE